MYNVIGIIGGLGSSIMELLFDSNNASKIHCKIIGLPSVFKNKIGNQTYKRKKFSLDCDGIKKQIIELWLI